MGAFLMHERGHPIDEAALGDAFLQRGFRQVRTMELGCAVLHLACKSHLELPNLMVRQLPGEPAATLAVTGTVVYDGLPWLQALERLMDDLLEDRLRPDRLAGACCLIFHRPARDAAPRVIGDPSGLYHMFQDDGRFVLSSSQLLTLAALPGPWVLDRTACLDLLTAGYLVAPRTLFRNLQLVTTACPPRQTSWYTFNAPLADILNVPVIRGGFAEHVEFQLDSLREHLLIYRGLTSELGMDMGLSGGYDSRLLVLLAYPRLGQLTAHTHVKPGADEDRMIARSLAGILGIQLSEPVTLDPSSMDAEALQDQLMDAFSFYDGRPVTMMSLLKPEYTPGYRIKALGGMGINLSGVGGEIYRNYNNCRTIGKSSLLPWVAYHVVNHINLECIAGKSVRDVLLQRLAGGILAAMDETACGSLDFFQTRRYYGEVWLPNWHGVRNSVENTLACYLAPFGDRRVYRNSLASYRHLGIDGAFEAAMIRLLDPQIAGLPSNYGHSFAGIPLGRVIKAGARAFVPNPLKLKAGSLMAARRGSGGPSGPGAVSSVLQQALDTLKELGLPLAWDRYLAQPSGRVLAYSLGYTLLQLFRTGKLRTDGIGLQQFGEHE